MAGFVVQSIEEEKRLDEGLTILARIFARNILNEESRKNQPRKEALNVKSS